jgi:Tellurite resistance protein TerB
MNLTGFTDPQKQALLDLLVLGMYADGKLDSPEDKRIEAVLDTMEFSSDSARQQFVDASFARARKHEGSPEATRAFVAEIAKKFSTPEIGRRVYAALEDLLSSDNQIADRERELLSIVSEELKL